MGYGSRLAIATSVASFLIYDFFFVRPLYTFSVAAPEEWLDLLLFLSWRSRSDASAPYSSSAAGKRSCAPPRLAPCSP